MAAPLDRLVGVRSRLAKEVLVYLDQLAKQAAELPRYFPGHLRGSEPGTTRFDAIRQVVQVVEDRAEWERWLDEERERTRAAGREFDHIAYAPHRARPERDEP